MATITIDIDAGGTFTDGFVVRDGVAHSVKTLTTPHDLAVCFRDVIDAAADALGVPVPDMLRETVAVRYATTVGTNTVLQRRGPRLGLLTDHSLPTGAGVGLFVEPEMVVGWPSEEEPDKREVALAAVRSLLHNGARGLVGASTAEDAVGRDAAERQLANLFTEHYPRHCLDSVPLLLAGEVAGDLDPERRMATALFNAYVHPDVADYLYRAEDYLREQGYARPLRVVHNDGGAARVARTIAGKTYNSGPMAGLLGARAVARHYGVRNLVTLDMGGTSLDVGILRDGEVPMREHGLVEDVEIAFPLPDLVPLGVGGGSVAWLDGDGTRVGPRSAGARPGPACFGLGGDEPTLTDADVLLGILRPEAFLAGSMAVSIDAARKAYQPLADRLGGTPEDAAARVHDTVHTEAGARLAAELRARDIDPTDVLVLAFGGNGATHCAEIASAAGIRDVLVLPFAPVFSAFGASTVDIRHRHEAAQGTVDEDTLRRRVLRDMRGEGLAEDEVTLHVQHFERDGARWASVEAGHELPHVELTKPVDTGVRAGSSAQQTPVAGHLVRWPGHGVLPTSVVERAGLREGAHLAGPALVESTATTCVVPPGWTLTIDEIGAARLTRAVRSTR